MQKKIKKINQFNSCKQNYVLVYIFIIYAGIGNNNKYKYIIIYNLCNKLCYDMFENLMKTVKL